MTSINTNASAMAALATLAQTNKSMQTTQNRIATGLRVSSAEDNAAYWSIATQMRSDNGALSAVQDSLGLGAATLDTAYTALNSTVKVVDDIKKKLVAARTPGVDRGKIQSEISELQKLLRGTAQSAVLNGENWLSVDSSAAGFNPVKNIVASFARTGGAISIGTVDVPLNSSKLLDAATETTGTNVTSITQTAGGTLAATAGSLQIAIAGGQTTTLNFAANSTLQDVATALNGVAGFTAEVTSGATPALTFAYSGSGNVTFTPTTLGLTFTNITTANTIQSRKGILDKSFDVFNHNTGATGAWEKVSVLSLDIRNITDSAGDLRRLETMVKGVDRALESITDAATNLGSLKARVGLQQDFVKALRDSMDRGIGQLVDADMSAESTRLQALQTQQQLGIQALSIANAGAQNILSLFRG